MNIAELNPSVIKCMKPEDRKALHLKTPEETCAAMVVKNEKQLQNQCENYLRLHGIEFLHLSFRAREKCGMPDISFANPNDNGRFYGIELKSVFGKVSEDQKRVMANLEKNGAHVAVVRSLEEFIGVVNNETKIITYRRFCKFCNDMDCEHRKQNGGCNVGKVSRKEQR